MTRWGFTGYYEADYFLAGNSDFLESCDHQWGLQGVTLKQMRHKMLNSELWRFLWVDFSQDQANCFPLLPVFMLS